MLTLSQAIWTKFDESVDLKALLVGGFFYGKAKQNTPLPYGVYTFTGVDNEDTFSSKIDGVSIQMNIYTKSDTTATECFLAYQACLVLYEKQVLTVSDSYDVTLTKIMEVPPMEVSNGTKWMAVMEFKCLLQKEEV